MRFNLLALLVLLPTLTGCINTRPVQVSLLPAKPAANPPIKNFDVVDANSNVYRGAQPLTKADWEFIKSLGVKTVLKLNMDSEGSDSEAELIGLTVVKIPITTKQQWFGPVPTGQIKDFIWNNRRDIYIHCEHGQDRTGLACYLYRRRNGWTRESAQTEMISHGFHKILWALWKVSQTD